MLGAQVAELVYAVDLKSASFTGLWVRVPSWAPDILLVLWRSGYAAVCKTAYTGSIPVGTSKQSYARNAR